MVLKIEVADTWTAAKTPFPEPIIFGQCRNVIYYFITDMSRSYGNKNESNGGTLLYRLHRYAQVVKEGHFKPCYWVPREFRVGSLWIPS